MIKIHNLIPHLHDCLGRWKSRPSRHEFEAEYAAVLNPLTGGFFEDFYEVLMDLDWNTYRAQALALSAEDLESRLRRHITRVESVVGFEMAGEVFLLGTFHTVDGYARFDCGTHQVFLGMDQPFADEAARDILIVHELTHVARESRAEVWTGWGLNPVMPQSEFTDSQPVIEHLMGEGFSCFVSELLVPGQPLEHYAYQSAKSLERVRSGSAYLDRAIHHQIKAPNGDYGRLYGLEPVFSHYVWAWQWVKSLYETRFNRDVKKMVGFCSKDLVESALQFELKNHGVV